MHINHNIYSTKNSLMYAEYNCNIVFNKLKNVWPSKKLEIILYDTKTV